MCVCVGGASKGDEWKNCFWCVDAGYDGESKQQKLDKWMESGRLELLLKVVFLC